ncbi:16030_t:CDS:1 [Cetraspora pellucida]|uniref:16030_t:CDS:1 n=1 Tax=Cetraspora pellucida TaxID=1433469 RepID=A0ACA9LP44_9GLOM|nr:16030_t:CDS:1 [Cetraspora pellucida]
MDQKLQQALLKVYQMLQPKQARVNIQFLENEIKITHPNKDSSITIIKETISPVLHQKKGSKIQNYVEEIFDNLLQALLKPDLSNRIKLFLYSKLRNKFSELDKKVSLKKIKQKIQRNGPRILKIASRASILYQEIRGYPIIEFKYSLTNKEFEKFMNEYRKESVIHFTGAQL